MSSPIRVARQSANAWDPRVCDSSSAFWPLERASQVFATCTDWPGVVEYAAAFEGSPPVRFELAAPKPRRGSRKPWHPAAGYDGRIHLARTVPTRHRNWHDFFNALVWATFPRAKWRLHERQFLAACARSPGGVRSREQDALTLFDEGGIVLFCHRSHERQVRAALALGSDETARALLHGGVALAVVFGHAIYEHLAMARPPVRGMVAVVVSREPPAKSTRSLEEIDAGLAALLERPSSFMTPSAHGSLATRLLSGAD